MLKKLKIITIGLIVFSFYALNASLAQDGSSPAAAKTAVKKYPSADNGMLIGSIISVDTSDPANPIIEARDESTGAIHKLSTKQWTSVTKICDISDLKPGDSARIIIQKTDGKEIAIGIIFGKVKGLPKPTLATETASSSAKPLNK